MDTSVETKVCLKCGVEKNIKEYSFHTRTRRRSECKSCKSKIDKEYRENNIEKIRTRRKKYYSENRHNILDYQKSYYSENKEYVLKRNNDSYNRLKEENKKETLEEERLNPNKQITCSKCGKEKHFSDFYFQSWGFRKKTCTDCENQRINKKLSQTLEEEQLNPNKFLICLNCEEELIFDNFPLNHGVRGNVCNDCCRIRQNEYSKRTFKETLQRTLEEERNNPFKLIKCVKCSEDKSFVYFGFHSFGTRRKVCKRCYGIQLKDYYDEHEDEVLEYRQNWRNENPDKISEGTRRYKQQLKEPQKPKWVNEILVNKIYRKMNYLNKESGEVKYSVDHIIPLNGDIVCGLHVENNLRIIPIKDNSIKNKKFISCSDSELPPCELELDPSLLEGFE